MTSESSNRPNLTIYSKKKRIKLVKGGGIDYLCGTGSLGKFGGTVKSFPFKQQRKQNEGQEVYIMGVKELTRV